MPAAARNQAHHPLSNPAVLATVVAMFIGFSGVGSMLPILPLFLRDHAIDPAQAGLIVAAAWLAQFLGQYPAGRLSDRIGPKPVFIGGLLLEAVGVAAFLIPFGAPWLLAWRLLQGLGSAAYLPASRAAVAAETPPEQLGTAYSYLTGAHIGGFVAGPAAGGLLALLGRDAVFAATAAALVFAAGMVLLLVTATRPGNAPVAAGPGAAPPPRGLRRSRPLRGAASLAAGEGLLAGIYLIVWSLYMQDIGAADWQIGASFSLWAAPAVLLTPVSGWAADRYDRRWLSVGAIAFQGAIAPIYPLLRSVPPIYALSVVEGSSAVLGEAPINAYLMDAVAPDQRGAAQGVVGAVNSGTMALGSAAGGVLYSFGQPVPFAVGGAACVICALLAIPFLRRRPVAAAAVAQPWTPSSP